ncbi:uroporphyrinogen decarboxylase [Aliifodinibius salipaludis]|uniref:Uroporphyrinogen decarboxylase n=1 Tax=Fodinibius salipaludis TaxID=2032627 RepID=A0A2A2GCB3_9BACT|nr:uroporphyrinogen decarboxylase [Aliifodinibius salipaludis]PAU94527.1 uroporphyrinogen decarboxylase [Aliifodinibius salipaludis]
MSNNFPELKNDLLLRALRGEEIERPPVWMMRQAGRYLPQYMKLRKKYTFFERVETPELACEITIQPIDELEPDAAIIFSDILTIPQALGIDVDLVKGKGPVMENPISSVDDAFSILAEDIPGKLNHVMEAITLTRKELNGRVPLIGFAGAPWTLFCYMVQGEGSKNFAKAKAFMYQHPDAAKHVMKELTKATIDYLKAQIKAGAQVVQLFDSWSGLLSPEDFNEWAMPYLMEICDAIDEVPVILFAKGSWYALERLSFKSNAQALGLDWTITPEYGRDATRGDVVLQGNFDPSKLMMPQDEIRRQTKRMIDRFGTQKYIANLGHGILPNIPVDNARVFVDTVKEYTATD